MEENVESDGETQPPVPPEYAAAAEKRGIKPIEGGDWFVIDGVTVVISGQDLRHPHSTEPGELGKRLGNVGEYATNNGLVSFIDQEGVQRVGIADAKNMLALITAGYTEGSLWVPLSNQEPIKDPAAQAEWLEKRDSSYEQSIGA